LRQLLAALGFDFRKFQGVTPELFDAVQYFADPLKGYFGNLVHPVVDYFEQLL